jgi:hypothetical protein
MRLEEDLIKKINSGNAILLIGSGLSIDIGLPSWQQFCILAINESKRLFPSFNYDKAIELVTANKFLEALDIAFDIPNSDQLFHYLQVFLDDSTIFKPNSVYSEILKWPFRIFLTTNFDNAIQIYLDKLRLPFEKKLNSNQDFLTYRTNRVNTIYKIHGDFTHPEDLVCSKKQYDNFQNSPSRNYWRSKLNAILQNDDVIIIGYSLYDPDFREQLTRVKEQLLPDQQIYIFLPNLTKAQQDDLMEYPIFPIYYYNQDGSHKELLRVIKRYSPFIAKRNSGNVGLPIPNIEEIEIASNLYTFTQLRLVNNGNSTVENAYKILILKILNDPLNYNGLDKFQIIQKLKTSTFSSFDIDVEAFESALEYLFNQNLISLNNNLYKISNNGKEKNRRAHEESETIRSQFIKACELFIEEENPGLSQKAKNEIVDCLINGLVNAFKTRGLELSRFSIGGENLDLSDSTDLLNIINSFSYQLSNLDYQNAFIDLMMHIFMHPNPEIKRFLSLISQGFFAFHALGYERRVLAERLEFARNTHWILDSNIIIYLLACNSNNNDYAIDLLTRARNFGINFYTTEMLVKEVIDHLYWAITTLINLPPDSTMFISAAYGYRGEKSNAFAEGYLVWQKEQSNPSFRQYLLYCFPQLDIEDIEHSIIAKFADFGIGILTENELIQTDNDFLSLRDQKYLPQVIQTRKSLSNYHSEDQCKAEAEVLVLDKNEYKFLSNSLLLNKISNDLFVWKPESLYRLLTLLNEIPPSDDLLHKCMLQDFYQNGIDVIDNDAIRKIASPLLKQSKFSFDQQKEAFVNAIGVSKYSRLIGNFDHVSESESPFYPHLFARYIEREVAKKAKNLESREESLQQREKQLNVLEVNKSGYARYLRNKTRKEQERLRAKRKRNSGKKKN